MSTKSNLLTTQKKGRLKNIAQIIVYLAQNSFAINSTGTMFRS